MNDFQIQPQMPPARRLGPAVQPYLPQRDHRKRNLIILICVIVAVTLITGILWFSYTHSASYRIQKGFVKLFREEAALKNPMNEKLGTEALYRMLFTEGGEADTKLNVTFNTFLGEVTLGVDTDYVKDMREKELSSSTALSIMNYEFGHVDVYADRENVCFSVPELFLEDLYVENEDVLAQYNRSMWADDWLFGEASGDDFSIDLFSAPWYVTDEEGAGKAFLNRYAMEIESCRRHMTMEKAGRNVYRVSFEGSSFNALVRQILSDYLHDHLHFPQSYREGILGIMSCFDPGSGSEEIAFLLEIDERGSIGSIRLEHPISLGRGAIRLDGDIYFLGGENSLEKMQGRIFFDNKEAEEAREQEIVWQVVRSLEQGEYRMEAEAKYSFLRNDVKQTVKLEGDFDYDGPKNSFKTKVSADIQETEFAMEASGDFSHIRKGEGFDLELDEVQFLIDGEQNMLVRGEIDLAPLSGRVKQFAEPKTALFAMGEDDWSRILEKIDREYGYLWEMAADYLY